MHYAWVVAAATFVLLLPLPHEFGWSVAGALGVTAASLSLSVGRRGLLRPTPSPA